MINVIVTWLMEMFCNVHLFVCDLYDVLHQNPYCRDLQKGKVSIVPDCKCSACGYSSLWKGMGSCDTNGLLVAESNFSIQIGRRPSWNRRWTGWAMPLGATPLQKSERISESNEKSFRSGQPKGEFEMQAPALGESYVFTCFSHWAQRFQRHGVKVSSLLLDFEQNTHWK